MIYSSSTMPVVRTRSCRTSLTLGKKSAFAIWSTFPMKLQMRTRKCGVCKCGVASQHALCCAIVQLKLISTLVSVLNAFVLPNFLNLCGHRFSEMIILGEVPQCVCSSLRMAKHGLRQGGNAARCSSTYLSLDVELKLLSSSNESSDRRYYVCMNCGNLLLPVLIFETSAVQDFHLLENGALARLASTCGKTPIGS